MKALKDCTWKVYFFKDYLREGSLRASWVLEQNKQSGIRLLYSNKSLRSTESAKKNFERFAELNGIKNWKFV